MHCQANALPAHLEQLEVFDQLTWGEVWTKQPPKDRTRLSAAAEITQELKPGLCCGSCDKASWWVRSATVVNTRLPRAGNGNSLN